VLLSDPTTGEIVYTNRRCARLLGYDDHELAAQRRLIRDVTHHGDQKRSHAEHARLIRGELDEYAVKLRVQRKCGEFVWVHIVATLLRDGKGRPQWCAASLKEFSSSDIREHQLATAEALAGLVTWSWDIKLDRTLASSRFMFGVPKPSVPPSFKEFLLMVHPEDRADVERTVARTIRTGGGYSHEYRLILPNGEIRWIRGMASCLYDEHGELTHLVGALIDRTKAVERQAAAPASNAMRNILKLIERDWNKDIYLSDIAKKCGVSPRAVQRYFAARGLVSFSRYVKRLRLGRAHGLLCEPKARTTVLGVALQCGFQNASHFSRDYRNEFGELPSDTLRNARLIKQQS